METKGIFLIACLAFLLHDANCGIFKDIGCRLCRAKNEVDESAEAPIPLTNHQPARNAPLPQSFQRTSSHVHHNPIQGSSADAHREISIQRELPGELSNYKLLDKSNDGGGSSYVELAQYKQNKTEVVIKITSKITTKNAFAQHRIEKFIIMAREEAEILKKLPRHRNIVQFIQSVETEENIYLVMEYVSGSDLYEYLNVNKLDENKAREVFKQVFEAIKHCHKHETVHGDLKPENVLIDNNYNIKLIDFGFAHKLKQGELLKDCLCNPYTSAPETHNNMEYDGFKSDIWTLGAILYELVYGLKWPGSNDFLGSEAINFPSHVQATADVKDLISNMLKIDVNKRFTLQQIMEHKWMKMGGSNTQSG